MNIYVKLIVENSQNKLKTNYTKETNLRGDCMGACLGISLGDKVVKYAKLEQDEKTKKISLNSYGTKYVVGEKNEVLNEIISETGSAANPLCLNLRNSVKLKADILKQLSKADIESVVNLEVSDYASSNDLNERNLEYRYVLSNSSSSGDMYRADILVAKKSDVTDFVEKNKLKNVTGIYPTEHLLGNLNRMTNSYMLLNVDETTTIIFVSGGKVVKIEEIDVSMKNILDTLAEREGSYARACDICRSINVLSDENITPELENLIEPVIQDLLNRVKSKMEEVSLRFDKIYLNGLINLFINIDMLFDQFFGLTTEKLKPAFLDLDENKLNVAEVMEVNEAISLAYEGLTKQNKDINFIKENQNKSSFDFSKLNINGVNIKDKFKEISGKAKDSVKAKEPKVAPQINVNKELIERSLLIANVAAASVFTGYAAFSGIFENETQQMLDKIKANITKIQAEQAIVENDISYIAQNTSSYTEVNEYVEDMLQRIEQGKIGKYTTYNVANFMQKIAKYIPSNVELESISSNNNKTVTIVAKSNSYAEIGYFIAELKHKGILTEVKTGKVDHSSTRGEVTVTIGGDLP